MKRESLKYESKSGASEIRAAKITRPAKSQFGFPQNWLRRTELMKEPAVCRNSIEGERSDLQVGR